MEKYNYNLGKLGEKIAEKYLIKNKNRKLGIFILISYFYCVIYLLL